MWCRTGISFISASTFEKSISERSVPLCFIARVLTCKSTLRRGLRLMPRIHLSCKCIPLVLPGHGPQRGLTGSMKEDKPGPVIRLAGSVPDSGDEASKRILGGGRINPNRSLDTPGRFRWRKWCFRADCPLLSASCSSLRLDVARYAFG